MISILMSLAFAQDSFTDAEIPPINVQHFRPTVDGQHTLWTDDAARGEHKRFFARPLFHYTRQPLVYEYEEQPGIAQREPLAIVNNILQGDLMVGFAYDRLRLGVDLPVYFFADGEGQGSASGIGDVAVDTKVTLLDGGSAPGVAINGRLSLPTSSIDKLPLGNSNPGWEIAAIVDQKLGDNFLLAGNLGIRGGNDVTLENVELNDFFVFRAAGAYLLDETSGVALEFAGNVPFSENAGQGMPIEVMLDGYTDVAPDVKVRGGIGTSLTSGVAAPDLRLLLGFEWRPTKDLDADDDGIDDLVDACPTVKEDADGEQDEDGCPDDIGVVVVKVVDADGKELPDAKVELGKEKGASGLTATLDSGSYTAKVTADGYEPGEAAIEVVDSDAGREVEVKLSKVVIPMGTLNVRVEDADGNPIEGATIRIGDRSFEGATLSEMMKTGDYEVRASAEGYKPGKANAPTLAKDGTSELVLTLDEAQAELKGERIDLRDRVYFDLSKATIQDRSFTLLDEVVAILTEHPELTKLRIEGHTDSRGSASSNKSLSQRRADSVRQYLIGKGIAADRLVAVGFGEDKPLDTAANEAAWAKNRRVDFFVAERTD